jgi:hypothetical protein
MPSIRTGDSLNQSLTQEPDFLMSASERDGTGENSSENWTLHEFFSPIFSYQFGPETHPAMYDVPYRAARTDENSDFPHFDSEQAHIQK